MPFAMNKNKLCQPKWPLKFTPFSSSSNLKESSRLGTVIASATPHSGATRSTPLRELLRVRVDLRVVLEALLEAHWQARHSCQCRMQRVRNAQYTRPSYLGHLARLAPRTVVLQAQQPLGHLVARGGREVVGPLACLDPNGERPVRLGPRLGAAPREVQRAGPVWKSTSELGYPEKYCVDLREPPRHRTDAVTGDNVASMA